MIPSHVDSEEGGGKDGQQVGMVTASRAYPKYDVDRWGQMIGNQIDDIVIDDLDINIDGISSTDDVIDDDICDIYDINIYGIDNMDVTYG